MLWDRLVCGINNQCIQRRLLAEPNLTFEKAKALAEAAERADENARELEKATPGPVGVHKIATGKTKEGGPHWSKSNTECYRCGGKHAADKCRFRDSDCHHCGKKGHIAKACRSRKRERTHPRSERALRPQPHSRSTTHHLGKSEEDSTAEAELHVFEVSERRSPPFVVKVQLNSCDVCMEVDTGASASIISEETFKSLWPTKAERPVLTPSSRRLQTYTGQELQIRGTINVNVEYDEQKQSLPLLVATGDGPSLIGRDWMMHIRLDWKKFALDLNNLQPAPRTALQDILQKHAAVFREELGLVRGTTAKIHMDATAQPRFCKARTVPFALRVKVDEELQRLQRTGVISPVRFSEWAAPIVPVTKRDGSVRICGDYKVTVNQATLPHSYPLPCIDDLFAALSGGRVFSKLDLAHAYQQISLDDESKKLVVINTQKGLFQYNRSPFGVSAAPAIFQRTIEGILREVCVYLDNILVTGTTKEEHLQRLDTVLQRLEEVGLRLKQGKCSFLLESVEYLGHSISASGLRPTKSKVRAITEAPTPQNETELRAFLGLVNNSFPTWPVH